jgi:hypothetical protein
VQRLVGSSSEELDLSISGPPLAPKADVRAGVPVGRVRADIVAKVFLPCGSKILRAVDATFM